MPRIKVTGVYQASTAEVDPDNDTGMTTESYDELFDVLAEAGLTEIDTELVEG